MRGRRIFFRREANAKTIGIAAVAISATVEAKREMPWPSTIPTFRLS